MGLDASTNAAPRLHLHNLTGSGCQLQSCSTSSPSNSQGLDATPLLHTAQSSAVRKRLHRICNAVDSDRRFGNAVHSAVSRCCTLLKAARHTSGCAFACSACEMSHLSPPAGESTMSTSKNVGAPAPYSSRTAALPRRHCLRLRRAAVFLQRHMRIELRSSAAVTSTAPAILANSA